MNQGTDGLLYRTAAVSARRAIASYGMRSPRSGFNCGAPPGVGRCLWRAFGEGKQHERSALPFEIHRILISARVPGDHVLIARGGNWLLLGDGLTHVSREIRVEVRDEVGFRCDVANFAKLPRQRKLRAAHDGLRVIFRDRSFELGPPFREAV